VTSLFTPAPTAPGTPQGPSGGAPPLTTGRRLALAFGVPILVFLIAFTGLNIVAAMARASFPVSRTLPVAGGRLAFSVNGGDINVTGGGVTGGAASLVGTVDYSLARPTLSFNPHDRQAGGAATIRLTCRSFLSVSRCGLNARLGVPAATAVTASTGGGNISVRDLTGTVAVSTDGGDVTAADLPGLVTLSSGGGNLTVSQLTGRTLRLTTDGGDITGTAVAVPDVRAATGGGNITLTLTRAPKNLDVSTDGGDVTIIVPRAAYVVNARTDGGTINAIKSVENPVGTINATTGGGNITIEYAA
jgi:hypothetical protein